MKCLKCGYNIPEYDDDEEEPMRADQGGHTLPLYVHVDTTGGVPA